LPRTGGCCARSATALHGNGRNKPASSGLSHRRGSPEFIHGKQLVNQTKNRTIARFFDQSLDIFFAISVDQMNKAAKRNFIIEGDIDKRHALVAQSFVHAALSFQKNSISKSNDTLFKNIILSEAVMHELIFIIFFITYQFINETLGKIKRLSI
jgi:hypothetical protein